MVWKCQDKVNELGKRNKVTLCAEEDTVLKGNEVIDNLAKKGSRIPFVEPELVRDKSRKNPNSGRMITYEVVAWSERTNLTIGRANLSNVQRVVYICMNNWAMWTCPTSAIEVIVNLTSLHILMESTVENYWSDL